MRWLVCLSVVAFARDVHPRPCKPPPVTPTVVALPGKAVSLAVGPTESCAVLATGRVVCWGGRPPTDLGLVDVVEVAVDRISGCARHKDGKVTCWGYKDGWNRTLPEARAPAPPATLVADRISVGRDHMCVATAGEVQCFGYLGSFGDFARYPRPGVRAPTALKAGYQRDCAIADGKVACWGQQVAYSCGAQCEADRRKLAAWVLPGVDDAVAIDIANDVCAVRATGAVVCWRGPWGRADVTVERIAGLSDARAIAGSCALRKNGEVACWGAGAYGQRGDGDHTPHRPHAGRVLGIRNAIAIGAGTKFACALIADGRVACWGHNNDHQLGFDSQATSTTAAAVCGLEPAVQLAAGTFSTCALAASGKVHCWGGAIDQYLGAARTQHTGTPTLIPDVEGVELVGASTVMCVRTREAAVRCWGAGSDKLARPSTATTQIAVGRYGLCGIARDGGVECLGQRVPYVAKADKVVVGDDFACALANKRATCWGPGVMGPWTASTMECPRNEHMACHEHSRQIVSKPRTFDDVLDIAAHDHEVCVQRAKGFECLKFDEGLGTPSSSTDPFATRNVRGLEHTCELRAKGTVWCWGDNTFGQLGQGSLGLVDTPRL